MLETLLAAPTRFLFFTGKGGVGKTSLSSATAIALTEQGRRVLLVSTDPASNLSEVLGSEMGRTARPVAGVAGLDALDIDPDAAAAAYRDRVVGPYRSLLPDDVVAGIEEQLSGACTVEIAAFDEFTALLADPDATAGYDHVVFDTAPTGHTLRLLTLPDFVDATLGKVVRLRQALTAAADAVKSVFGQKSAPDPAVVAAEALRDRTRAARALFRDKERTRFVIVTIPTVMAAAESIRLAAALSAEGVPIGGVIVNQVLCEGEGDAFVASRRRDQDRALATLRADTAGLASLQIVEAPVVDLEVRGVGALRYFGDAAWVKGAAAAAAHAARSEETGV